MSWRDRLAQASFKGVGFYVDDDAVESGRRVVVHEYPLRDTPATEDLGRSVRRTVLRGYTIGPDYDVQLAALRAACEGGGAGLLRLRNQGGQTVRCVFVSTQTRREDGGYGTADMEFVEAGAGAGFSIAGIVTAALSAAAGAAASAAATLGNRR